MLTVIGNCEAQGAVAALVTGAGQPLPVEHVVCSHESVWSALRSALIGGRKL